MRKSINLNIENKEGFFRRLLIWANTFSHVAYFDSNNYYQYNFSPTSYHSYEKLVAVDSIKTLNATSKNNFNNLKKFLHHNKDWVFGHFSYDLKNEIENLTSQNIDHIKFPLISFFIPKYLFIHNEKGLFFLYHPEVTNEQ